MAQLSEQLQETATMLNTASQAYSNASNDTGTVSAEALAGGIDLAQNWQGRASQSFLNSLGRLADDTGKTTEALLSMSGILSNLASTITSNLEPIRQYETALKQGTALDTSDPYIKMNQALLPADVQAKQVSQANRDQALRAIYDAANKASSELDQITYVGTCSSVIMNGIGDWIYLGASLIAIASALPSLRNTPPGAGGGGSSGIKGKFFNCLAWPTNGFLQLLAKLLIRYPKLMTNGFLRILVNSSPGIGINLVSSLKKNGFDLKAVGNPQFLATLVVNLLVGGALSTMLIQKSQNMADEMCAANPGINKNQLKTAIQMYLGNGVVGIPISLATSVIVSDLTSSSSSTTPPQNTYIGDYHGFHIYEIGQNTYVAETDTPASSHAVSSSITQNPGFQKLIHELENHGK